MCYYSHGVRPHEPIYKDGKRTCYNKNKEFANLCGEILDYRESNFTTPVFVSLVGNVRSLGLGDFATNLPEAIATTLFIVEVVL